jgi:hypothetical protein
MRIATGSQTSQVPEMGDRVDDGSGDFVLVNTVFIEDPAKVVFSNTGEMFLSDFLSAYYWSVTRLSWIYKYR